MRAEMVAHAECPPDDLAGTNEPALHDGREVTRDGERLPLRLDENVWELTRR
jgi:hypothetical protein